MNSYLVLSQIMINYTNMVPKIFLLVFSFALYISPLVVIAQSTTTATDTVTLPATSSVTLPATTSMQVPIITLPDYRKSSNVEAKVRMYFADIPVMIAIASCESRFRQFDSTGNPLNGGSGGMIGVYQINGPVHAKFALTLGYDIYTVDGNLSYARYLHQMEGTNPWISSFPCWSTQTSNPEITTTSNQTSTVPTTSPNTSSGTLTTNLSFGMIHPEILTLQKILNSTGYTITNEGPGSPGNETTKFGSLTRESIRRFQCAKGLVCSGDEGSTGYGYVGARTRQALVAASPSTLGNSQATNTSNQNGSQPTTQPTPNVQASNEKADKIKSLESQITQYQKLINELQTQINQLKN